MISKFLLLLSIVFFAISCGFPDTSSIYVDLNQPYITQIVPGPNSLTIRFQAQNNEEAFTGYNIFYGDNVTPNEYKMLNSQFTYPTITAVRSEVVNEYEFTIALGQNYSNSSGNDQLTAGDLPNGYPRYVVVTAYDLFNNRQSTYSYSNYVMMGCPRPEVLGATISSDGSFDGISVSALSSLATLQNNNGTLQIAPVSGGGIQMQTATSLADITQPPENGYVSTPINAIANRIYLLTAIGTDEATYYGKIFVNSVNGTTSINADYAIQISAGITNY